MSDGTFEYNPAVMADQVQLQQSTSHTLDDIGNRAQQALQAVRPFFDGQGGTAYVDASNIIHQGIQEGKDVIWRQGQVTHSSHEDTIGGDIAAANAIGGF